MINIDFQENYKMSPITAGVIYEFSAKLLNLLNIDANEQDLSIVIGNNHLLLDLNSRFMGHDYPTDVLSFPSDEIDPDSGRKYMGDVIISMDKVFDQSASSGHPVESELKLLIVHGILHLVGYDHLDEVGKAEMWNLQQHLLNELNVTPINLPD